MNVPRKRYFYVGPCCSEELGAQLLPSSSFRLALEATDDVAAAAAPQVPAADVSAAVPTAVAAVGNADVADAVYAVAGPAVGRGAEEGGEGLGLLLLLLQELLLLLLCRRGANAVLEELGAAQASLQSESHKG